MAWMQKEETPIPDFYMEIINLTSVIGDKEDMDVATIDIPNFYI